VVAQFQNFGWADVLAIHDVMREASWSAVAVTPLSNWKKTDEMAGSVGWKQPSQSVVAPRLPPHSKTQAHFALADHSAVPFRNESNVPMST